MLAKRIARKIRRILKPEDWFLRRVGGVIHVGANTGQEREIYAKFNLNVIWIEPIPACFDQLVSHLAGFPKQRAYRCLITDRDEGRYNLHIANNGGASSSILPLAKHREMWPDVSYQDAIELPGLSLSTFVRLEAIDLSAFQALILDTQGSELMILKGAAEILERFRFLKVEAADFESYEGCCHLDELVEFMTTKGFRERRREPFASLPTIGTYYDVLFERVA